MEIVWRRTAALAVPFAVGVVACSRVGTSNGPRPDLSASADLSRDLPVGEGSRHCFDRRISGDESDIDCGGRCTPCAIGHTCEQAGDCLTAECTDSRCTSPSCGDRRIDSLEACDDGNSQVGDGCDRCALELWSCRDGPTVDTLFAWGPSEAPSALRLLTPEGVIQDLESFPGFDGGGLARHPDGDLTLANTNVAASSFFIWTPGQALRQLAQPTITIRSSAYDVDGTLYAIASENNTLNRVDPVAGTTNAVHTFSGEKLFDIAFHPDGSLYGVRDTAGELVRISMEDFSLEIVASAGRGLNGIAITQNGRIFVGANTRLFEYTAGSFTELNSGVTGGGDLASCPPLCRDSETTGIDLGCTAQAPSCAAAGDGRYRCQ